MTYPVAMEKDLCLVCGGFATQYFDSNNHYPLCGRMSCDDELAEQINAEFRAAAAEAATTKGD